MTARRTLLQLSMVALLAVGAGLAGAWVWESRWTPVTGVALHHEFVLDQQGGAPLSLATGLFGWLLAGLDRSFSGGRQEDGEGGALA